MSLTEEEAQDLEYVQKMEMDRHDLVCKLLRDASKTSSEPLNEGTDIPSSIIVLDMANQLGFEPDLTTVNHCTPDFYYLDTDQRQLLIIDVKARNVGMELLLDTKRKYVSAFTQVCRTHNIGLKVVIVNWSLDRGLEYTDQLPYMPEFLDLLNTNYAELQELTEDIRQITRNQSGNFMKAWHTDMSEPLIGDFTDVPVATIKKAVLEHAKFKEFSKSIGDRRTRELIKVIENYNPDSIDNLRSDGTLDEIERDYAITVEQRAREVLANKTAVFEVPNTANMTKAFTSLESRISIGTKGMSLADAKPDFHSVWAPATKMTDPAQESESKTRLVGWMSKMAGISDHDEFSRSIQVIVDAAAHLASKADDVTHTAWNEVSRAAGLGYKTTKHKEIIVTDRSRNAMLDDMAKVGRKTYKKEVNTAPEDAQCREDVLTEKKSLHPTPGNFSHVSDHMDTMNKQMSQPSLIPRRINAHTSNSFRPDLPNSNRMGSKGHKKFMDIGKTKMYEMVTDFSNVGASLLSQGYISKRKGYRVQALENNNMLLVLCPGDSLGSSNGDVAYYTLAFAKRKEDLVSNNCHRRTYSTPDGFIMISRPVRLDKTRVRSLMDSVYVYTIAMMTVADLHPMETVNDACYTLGLVSCNCTKSLMSVTDSIKYMTANSLADFSNAAGFITEKFEPIFKTFGSLHWYQNCRRSILETNRAMQKSVNVALEISENKFMTSGVKGFECPSMLVDSMVDQPENIMKESYILFYLNKKNLHSPVQNIIGLTKVPLEWEEKYQQEFKSKSRDLRQQTGQFTFSYDVVAGSLHEHYKHKINNANTVRQAMSISGKLDGNMCDIPTFTSTKSVMLTPGVDTPFNKKVSDDPKMHNDNYLTDQFKKDNGAWVPRRKWYKQGAVTREKATGRIPRELLANHVKEYRSPAGGKVFDQTYKRLLHSKQRGYKQMSDYVMIHDVPRYEMTVFPKGQRTTKDREIYKCTLETKIGLYFVETASKYAAKFSQDEMISRGGEKKIQVMRQRDMDHINKVKRVIGETENCNVHTCYINTDMSKFSAADSTEKMIMLIAFMPTLKPAEKYKAIKFLLDYMEKKLVIPDVVMSSLINQKYRTKDDDVYARMTDNYQRNWCPITQNWLQGNLNYSSSIIHMIMGEHSARTLKKAAEITDTKWVDQDTVCHSDDGRVKTTIIWEDGDAPFDLVGLGQTADEITASLNTLLNNLIAFNLDLSCRDMSFTLNVKKSYMSTRIQEFLQIVTINVKEVVMAFKDILPIIGDVPFNDFQTDMTSMLSKAQIGARNSASVDLLWAAISVGESYIMRIYSMLPGQTNDPCAILQLERTKLPLGMGGAYNADLSLLAALGPMSHDYDMIYKLLRQDQPLLVSKGSLNTAISRLTYNILNNRQLQFLCMAHPELNIVDGNSTDSYQSEAFASCVLMKMQTFTGKQVLNGLESFKRYYDLLKSDNLSQYAAARPDLVNLRATNDDEYLEQTVFRYLNRNFRVSLALRSSNELLATRMLHAKQKVIVSTFLSSYRSSPLTFEEQDFLNIREEGRLTIVEAFEMIRDKAGDYTNDILAVRTMFQRTLMQQKYFTFLLVIANESQAGQEMPLADIYHTRVKTPISSKTFKSPLHLLIRHVLLPDLWTKSVIQTRYKLANDHYIWSECAILKKFLQTTQAYQAYLLTGLAMSAPNVSLERQKMHVSTSTGVFNLSYTFLTFQSVSTGFCYTRRPTRNPIDHALVMRGGLHKPDVFVQFSINMQFLYTPDSDFKDIVRQTDFIESTAKSICVISHIISTYVTPGSQAHAMKIIVENATNTGLPLIDIVTGNIEDRRIAPCLVPLKHAGLLKHSWEEIHTRLQMSYPVRAYWTKEHVSRIPPRGEFEVDYHCGSTTLTLKGYGQFPSTATVRSNKSSYFECWDPLSRILAVVQKDFRLETLVTSNIQPCTQSGIAFKVVKRGKATTILTPVVVKGTPYQPISQVIYFCPEPNVVLMGLNESVPSNATMAVANREARVNTLMGFQSGKLISVYSVPMYPPSEVNRVALGNTCIANVNVSEMIRKVCSTESFFQRATGLDIYQLSDWIQMPWEGKKTADFMDAFSLDDDSTDCMQFKMPLDVTGHMVVRTHNSRGVKDLKKLTSNMIYTTLLVLSGTCNLMDMSTSPAVDADLLCELVGLSLIYHHHYTKSGPPKALRMLFGMLTVYGRWNQVYDVAMEHVGSMSSAGIERLTEVSFSVYANARDSGVKIDSDGYYSTEIGGQEIIDIAKDIHRTYLACHTTLANERLMTRSAPRFSFLSFFNSQ